MKKVAIIQARMTSSRLPGKVLMQVHGKSFLEHQIDRVRRVPLLDQIVVATTVHSFDDPIVELCERRGISFYRGSEEDVLGRYYEAAKIFKADVVVRLTSDCPLVDPFVITKVIQTYLDAPSPLHYVSNTLQRTYPRGLDTEVFSFDVLEKAFKEADQTYDREHVTPYIYSHEDRFQLGSVLYETDESQHRWTLDMPEDLKLITKIMDHLYIKKEDFILEDVLHLLEENPDWKRLNEHIRQKGR